MTKISVTDDFIISQGVIDLKELPLEVLESIVASCECLIREIHAINERVDGGSEGYPAGDYLASELVKFEGGQDAVMDCLDTISSAKRKERSE